MLEQILKSHLRIENPFPRRVGYESNSHFIRPLVKNIDVFMRIFDLYKDKDFYTNIFSEEQKQNKTIDTIWLDIDINKGDKNSENAYNKYLEVYDKIKQFEPRSLYSGRGFHINADFEPIKIKHYYPMVVSFLDKHKILDLIDKQTIELNRVSRVPYTKNTKTGLYCVPINNGDSLKEVIEYAKNPIPLREIKFKQNHSLREELIEINKNIKEYVVAPFKNGYRVIKSEKDYPPCIVKFLKDIETGGLEHIARLQLAMFLIKMEKDDNYISKIFKKTKDYNDRQTQYQLGYIRNRGLKLYGCEKMRTFKLCPTMVCPFYPSCNFYL